MGHRGGKDLAQEKEVSSRRWIDTMVGATGREKPRWVEGDKHV